VVKELLTQRLAGSVTLERLRSAQMLDRHDIEGVIHVSSARFLQNPPESCILSAKRTLQRLQTIKPIHAH
jgi:hypothetical protein